MWCHKWQTVSYLCSSIIPTNQQKNKFSCLMFLKQQTLKNNLMFKKKQKKNTTQNEASNGFVMLVCALLQNKHIFALKKKQYTKHRYIDIIDWLHGFQFTIQWYLLCIL